MNEKQTPEIIRKVKARSDQNPRRSGGKIARELNISREWMQHILKNELWLKPLKLQKVQELTDRQQKGQRVTSLARKWPVTECDFLWWEAIPNWAVCEDTKCSALLVKIVSWKITSAIGHQTLSVAGKDVNCRNGRWSLAAPIHLPWGQNKCRILSGKCLTDNIKALGRQTFRPQIYHQDSAPPHLAPRMA